MYYFAYGSNLSRARLKERVGNFSKEEKCIAEDYKLTFDDRGKADIITSVGSKVYGIIYELSTDQMNELDRYEGVKMGVYMRLPILVKVNDKPTEAVAYVKVTKTLFHKPEAKYLKLIIDGLLEHGFNSDVIDKVKGAANS